MESTAGLRNLPEGEGRAGTVMVTLLVMKGPMFSGESLSQGSRIQCVHTPFALLPGPGAAGLTEEYRAHTYCYSLVLGLPEPQTKSHLAAVSEWAPERSSVAAHVSQTVRAWAVSTHREAYSHTCTHPPLCLPTTVLFLSLLILLNKWPAAPLLTTLSWLILWNFAFGPCALMVFAH